jgi:ABC-type transporter Mla MlaB component
VFRITTVHEDEKTLRLCLCGQFTAEYVGELEKALNTVAGSSQSVAIDMTNVTLVDREAMKFLCNTHSKDIPVENIPPYVQRWIEQEKACSKTEDRS